MKTGHKVIAVAALVGAVVFLVEVKNRKGDAGCAGRMCLFAPSGAPAAAAPAAEPPARQQTLPRLVDLGSSQCVPCKMMKPALDDLMANYADRFETVFIDVVQDPQAGHDHGIGVIPTQIFYDEDGKELFRHEGFLSKEEILAKWQELGYGF